MLIHTRRKALAQGPISLTRHRINLICRLVLYGGGATCFLTTSQRLPCIYDPRVSA